MEINLFFVISIKILFHFIIILLLIYLMFIFAVFLMGQNNIIGNLSLFIIKLKNFLRNIKNYCLKMIIMINYWIREYDILTLINEGIKINYAIIIMVLQLGQVVMVKVQGLICYSLIINLNQVISFLLVFLISIFTILILIYYLILILIYYLIYYPI